MVKFNIDAVRVPQTYYGFGNDQMRDSLFRMYRAMTSSTSRDEYDMWVRQCKALYKIIGIEIKRIRFDIKRYNEWQRGDKSYAAERNIATRQREIARLARYAAEMIEMRRNNKIMAKIAADQEFNSDKT